MVLLTVEMVAAMATSYTTTHNLKCYDSCCVLIQGQTL